MASHQRTSASSRRGHSGSPDSVSEFDRNLRDELHRAHAEIDRLATQREHYRTLYEKATQKLSEGAQEKTDLKEQVRSIKEEHVRVKKSNDRLRAENEEIQFHKTALQNNYTQLQAQFEILNLRYGAASSPSSTNPMTAAPLPDRTKPSRTSSKREVEDRGRARERSHREEDKAEKQKKRLSKRFEDSSNRHPPTSYRAAYIEGWGPNGGRSSSANPVPRSYGNMSVATGHLQSPKISAFSQTAYSTVPRPPAGSSQYHGHYDGGLSEDGSYHPYPI